VKAGEKDAVVSGVAVGEASQYRVGVILPPVTIHSRRNSETCLELIPVAWHHQKEEEKKKERSWRASNKTNDRPDLATDDDINIGPG
jgi:hypothetical protein